MFGRDESKKSKTNEVSFDFKLLIAYHMGIMLLFACNSVLTIGVEGGIVGALVAIAVVLSWHHRSKFEWRWPGVGGARVIFAGLCFALGLLFLYAATARTSPFDAHIFPWFAGGLGIISFGFLEGLNITYKTETAFLRHCVSHDADAPDVAVPGDIESAWTVVRQVPKWKRIIIGAFLAYCLMVWLALMAVIWQDNVALRDGLAKPTNMNPVAIKDHGHVVYISEDTAARVHMLRTLSIGGVVSLFLIFGGLRIAFCASNKLAPLI